MSPVLTQSEQERLEQIYGTLEQGQFYAIKDILHSKTFLRSFAFDLGKMASRSRDNAKEKNIGNKTHVLADVGESSLSRGDPPSRGDHTRDELKKRPAAKALAKSKATSGCARSQDVPTFAAPREGTSANPGVVLEFEASTMNNPAMAEKLFQGIILLANKKTVVENLDNRVAKLEAKKQRAEEELRKFKEAHDVDMEKHEKEMAEMKRKEALTKSSIIYEFKSSDKYKEAVEEAVSSYFGEGFDVCNKQIGTLHPNLDIQDLQINPNLVDEDEENEKNELDVNLP
ncbi:hypothetical protein Acr_00g0011920 [Actinidia rufa]|uniref:Uncharacterized protein n=1 Tax=Actinidia rufa TaxID=165716 RepID=A0A7J0DB04_9ERIC|nr:hypothetical protein Acr_00g0011920 [Actinidia rufa]